jgi:hypothetical protein
MGYTHYWRHAELPADLFAEIIADAKAIVENSPVPLASWDGTGAPEFTEDEFSLNGADPDDYETFSLRTWRPTTTSARPASDRTTWWSPRSCCGPPRWPSPGT